jgi:Acyl-CoA carboxylase epsilon subunit
MTEMTLTTSTQPMDHPPTTEQAGGGETIAPWLRVVRGDPTDDELAALIAVFATATAQHRLDEQLATPGAAPATMVLRRTGRAAPGRGVGRAPTVSRPRWRSLDAARQAPTADAWSTRGRRAS